MKVRFDHVGIILDGTEIVRDATFAVEPGQFAGLVGPNGSGKSTLLRSLYRVVRPERGTVHVGDLDVWRTPLRTVAQHIAVMTQESNADFDLDVLDVVLLGRIPHQRGFGADSAYDLDLAERALRDVGAAHLTERAFAALSGGEKQRVLLARAMVQASPVLVLDEPTNHLDISFQLELMRLVGGLGLTTVAALHDLNLAVAHCDIIAVMDHGRLVASGAPADVLTTELIGDVFKVRSRRLIHPDTGGLLIAFTPAGNALPNGHAPRTQAERNLSS
ncbi:ABC transporter ATP-binding protein [Phytoactinopolyspora mesophila]|uniref:ATP-binding cassette domain-containing protein n=1 Tax=Phytoactinopolyspora mesophila TaxID=2650750 RepID=A0A7K3M798_9ACTN|nr:ABC transporter ATP-binding protein [Phytoactinopolyspora mesophila]NDL59155.1 ATP-binding cassette domain-containing protein [Phytoactinopolyspora mesophila]